MQIVLYGSGKQAELAHYYFTYDSPYEVVAFCVESAYLPAGSPMLLGLPIVGFEEISVQYPAASYKLHVAVGQIGARKRFFEAAKAKGYSFVNYISPLAQIWPDLVIGENVFIDQGSRLHPFVTVGDNVMLIGAQIGHHSHVGSHTLLSTCILGGSVTINSGSFVGMGTVINEGVQVGANNIIGSGCLISRSTKDNAIYSGNATKSRQVDTTRFALFKR
jgi:sugar O-acyltransferase (sialic acid O-acetyltransferase NeuD family)